jgi:hypothetical protein
MSFDVCPLKHNVGAVYCTALGEKMHQRNSCFRWFKAYSQSEQMPPKKVVSLVHAQCEQMPRYLFPDGGSLPSLSLMIIHPTLLPLAPSSAGPRLQPGRASASPGCSRRQRRLRPAAGAACSRRLCPLLSWSVLAPASEACAAVHTAAQHAARRPPICSRPPVFGRKEPPPPQCAALTCWPWNPSQGACRSQGALPCRV